MATRISGNASLANLRVITHKVQRTNAPVDFVKEKSVGSKIVAESNGDDLAELMGYDKWPREVSLAFDRALGVVSVKYLKDLENRTFSFAAVVADFRALEVEYAMSVGDEENVKQVRRIITEKLLQMTSNLDEPFETSQLFWHELQALGFYRIEREINNTWMFAEICREHGQTDVGLSVIEPVIAKVEALHAKPGITQWATEYYEQELGYLRKLRVRLETERGEQKET